MTAPDPRLDAIKKRVAEAEEKRARCRANPDPIFSAGMMLAIQASSADVPYLLSVVEAQAGQIAKASDLAEAFEAKAGHRWAASQLRAALAPEGPEA